MTATVTRSWGAALARSAAHLLALCALLVAPALTSCGGPGADEGGADEISSGTVFVRPKGGEWAEQGTGPLAFVQGTSVEAGPTPAAITVAAGSARVRFHLEPGARLSRRTSNAFDLWTGSMRVESVGIVPRVFLFHSDNYVDAEGLKAKEDGKSLGYTAVTDGKRLAVRAFAGRVQSNTIGKDHWEVEYVVLKAGEQGLVEPGVRPTKHDLSDTARGPLLRPSVALEVAPGSVASGAPTRVRMTIAPGQSGVIHGLAWEGSDAEPFVIVAESEAGSHDIALTPDAVLAKQGPGPLTAVTATTEEPLVLAADLGPNELTTGTWTLRARYTSYKRRADGTFWLGSVLSEPVEVVIP